MIDRKDAIEEVISLLEDRILNPDIDLHKVDVEKLQQLGFVYYSNLLALNLNRVILNGLKGTEKEGNESN